MTIKKILQDDVSNQHKSEVLGLNGNVVDILTDLPRGYEYRLHRLSNAYNSKTVLLIVETGN
jgi:hypothetical protein